MLQRRLPDWINAYLKFVEDTEPPRLYEKWGAISIIASVLERKVWMIWDNKTFINLYVILVGPSGVRKTVTLDHAFDFVSAVDGLMLAPNSTSPRRLLSVMEDSYRDIPTQSHGVIGQSALTVWSEEFSVFLKYDNKDMIELLTDFYDCKDNRSWTHETQHSGRNEIKNLWLNLLACTTPDALQETLIMSAVGKGLGSRITFVYADKPSKYIVFPFERFEKEFDLQLKDDLINDIQYIGTLLTGQFSFDPGFLDLYKSWYPEKAIINAPEYLKHPNFSGYLNRRAKHLLKLCMIFSVSNSNDLIIRPDDFNRAISLMDETEPLMPNVFGGIGEHVLANVIYKVASLLRDVKRISFDDLCTKFMYDCSDEDMSRRILPSLRKARIVKKEPKIEGGKLMIELEDN